MVLTTVYIPKADLETIHELIRARKYPNRSDFIRNAIKRQIEYEEWRQTKKAFPVYFQTTIEEIARKVQIQALKTDPVVQELIEDLIDAVKR